MPRQPWSKATVDGARKRQARIRWVAPAAIEDAKKPAPVHQVIRTVAPPVPGSVAFSVLYGSRK